MALRLICGPAGSGKTREAVRVFLDAVSRGSDPVLVAPTLPDARHFERHLLRRLQDGTAGVLTGGRVRTFDRLCRELVEAVEPGAELLGHGERQLLIRALVEGEELRKLQRSSGFDGFAAALAALIAELEMLGIEPGKMGKQLSRWTGGNRWRQGLVHDLFLLYEAYQAALRQRGVYDSELFQRRGLELVEEGAVPVPRVIILDGFWDFTPLQHQLIRKLADVTDMTVTLPFQEGNEAYRAPGYHREQLAGLGEVSSLEPDDGGGVAPALRHLADNLFRYGLVPETTAGEVDAAGAVVPLTAAGTRGQAELVAAEILRLWREGGSLDEIAVVFRSSGRDMLAVAAALDEFGVPCDMPVPVPLEATVVGKAALALLEFSHDGTAGSLLAYLRSPLSVVPPDMVDKFDRRIRLRGRAESGPLLRLWKELGGRDTEDLRRLRDAAATGLQPLAAELCRLLESMVRAGMNDSVRPAGRFDSDLLALDCLMELCTQAAAVRGTAAAIHTGGGAAGRTAAAGDSAGFLRRGIGTAEFRLPSLTRRGCVRLLDPHRLLNQRFDTVFVCGLLEKRFPSLGREDSFFPDDDRRELAAGFGLSLDSHERRLDEERFLFHRTVTRARRRLYLCYPYCDSDGRPTIRSLFVDDALELFAEGSLQPVRRSISEVDFRPSLAPTSTRALRSLALLHETGDPDSAAGLAAVAEPVGLAPRLKACLAAAPDRRPAISDTRVLSHLAALDLFSVTGLQRYLGCPFRFLVEDLLQPVDMEPAAYPLRRGQFIHQILCRLGELLMKTGISLPQVEEVQLQEIRNQLNRIIQEQFAGMDHDLETTILRTELTAHLHRFIDREVKCGRKLRYFDFEAGFGAGRGDCGGRRATEAMLNFGDFRLRGRLDRIDWLDTGQEPNPNIGIVIDYKASSVSHLKDFADKKEIQIPLYLMALRDIFGLEPIAGEYCSIRKQERGGLYLEEYRELLGDCSGEVNDKDFVDRETFDRELAAAGGMAVAAVADIRGGVFPTEPVDEKFDCKYCGFDGICRYSGEGTGEVNGHG